MNTDGISVLLGAGASVEAGLPTSADLTQKIASFVDQSNRIGPNISAALHVAIGAIIAHDTGHGHRAYDGIDVERLFAAIRMLAQRDSLEIAPFISAWNPNLDGLGTAQSLPLAWGRSFKNALDGHSPTGTKIGQKFTEGVTAITRQKDLGSLFTRLQSEMVRGLSSILTVDESRIDYLSPLLQDVDGTMQIATLNYDLSVELLAERAGIRFDTGIEGWRGGYQWKWRPGMDLRLLKLHGSLGWYFGSDQQPGKLSSDIVEIAEHMSLDEQEASRDRLALVFGQGAKLRSDGPFLAMLLEFDRFLERTEHLVVVGYSFRDDHINAAIRRWFNKRRQPRVTVIDPSIETWENSYRSTPPFFAELRAAMSMPDDQSTLLPGHQLISVTAGPGLERALGKGRNLRASLSAS